VVNPSVIQPTIVGRIPQYDSVFRGELKVAWDGKGEAGRGKGEVL
jgi:hypothetical protein